MSAASFRDLIDHHFNQAEIQQLCFDLQISYENLPGKTRIMKAQALVEHCLRHELLAKMTARCAELRPGLPWPDGAQLAAEWQQIQTVFQTQESLLSLGLLSVEKLAELQQREASLQQIIYGDKIAGDKIDGNKIVVEAGAHYHEAPSPYPAHWESHYLEALITQCDQLDLTPLSAGAADEQTLSIAAVFTTLYLAGATRQPDQTVAAALAPGRGQTRPDEMAREEERLPITASAAIAAMPRLVVLGDPGGGKSTLVNYLTAGLARRRLGQAASLPVDWPETHKPLPVRIIMRRFADWLQSHNRQGQEGDVWDYLADLLKSWGCAESFEGLKAAFIADGGLFFFDGLDEIRDRVLRKSLLSGAIRDFAATHSRCQLIVTGRPYAYEAEAAWRLPEEDFPVVRLAPFAPEQIAAFNETWYLKVMAKRRGWTQTECQARANILTETIAERPYLRDLAGSPLLLTLMAQLHSQGGTLPDNRADLYRQTIDLLLHRWDNRIVLDAHPGAEIPDAEILYLGVPTAHLRDVLAQLAYQVHRRQAAQAGHEAADRPVAKIDRDQLRLALAERFDSLKMAEQIITYVQNRAGLLLYDGIDAYSFPHRTFQEYLAARHLLSQGDWPQLLRHHLGEAPDWWREIFLLTAGIAAFPGNIEQQISHLLPFGPGQPEMPLTAEVAIWAQIAAQTLVETNFAYHVRLEEKPGPFTAIYRRVQAWLKVILVADGLIAVPERAAAGRWLAQLGDNRPGVGVRLTDDFQLPDILWGEIVPAGRYDVGGDKDAYESFPAQQVEIKQPYRLSCYPVTNAQFQCFVAAIDRDQPEWWVGIPDSERQFAEPAFPYNNHPRESVSWYQAIAFCRWLNAKLSQPDSERMYLVSLPHEIEWEVAARQPGERHYPWGNDFSYRYANTRGSGLGSTTTVGMYPDGQNELSRLFDLSGNVLEWCHNADFNRDINDLEVDEKGRVLRGGSWFYSRNSARLASRSSFAPDRRLFNVGFRLVRRHL